MKYSSDKDIHGLIAKKVKEGWTYTKGKNHGKLRSPKGSVVFISVSPSCCWAFKNVQGDIARAEKKDALK